MLVLDQAVAFDIVLDRFRNFEADEPEIGDLVIGFELDSERRAITTQLANGQEDEKSTDIETTINLRFDYQHNALLGFHVDYEIESTPTINGHIEESYVRLETEIMQIRLGRMKLPFGQSESEFITGPVLEFGEISEDALLARADIGMGVNLTGYIFPGDVHTDPSKDELDGGMLVLYHSDDEGIIAGLGYISDLWEATDPLDDIDIEESYPRVPAISGHFLVEYDNWLGLVEHVTAIDDIENFEPEFNRPASTSVELMYAHSDKWLFGLRSEYNSELEDFPKRQHAVMARYYFVPNLSIGIEYLKSRYRSGVTNDDDVEIDEENTLSIEISLDF